MSKSQLRIVNDIVNFKKDKPNNIFININKQDIYNIKAMIVGPINTPYFGGFYFFDLIFPKDYPNNPPKVTFLTTDGKVRFNPNLYGCGKVCLSILGTWAGPGWTPVMNLTSILLSIESLLCENPIINEPGYQNIKPSDNKSVTYNNYILYFNYKIAISNILNNKYDFSNKFKKDILEIYKHNYQKLNDNLLSYKLLYDKYPILNDNKIYFINSNLKFIDFNILNLKKID